ncbi:large neutral amino acids transporter small subunit 2 [Salvelinus namaycush]|uniref:Large neutral amino acids transporter small subunit 2 n=1 Tax=Salvelinus namaycush TaxID=8040 RepID=A0A8U0TLR0_SALNM|nr:large neutral amino acids transporter small subunit 2 [Salvelinus namaycush]
MSRVYFTSNIIGPEIFVSPKGVMENASSVGLALVVWIVTGVITAIVCPPTVIYPTNQAVIILTFSNYILQPHLPSCFPPQRVASLLMLTWVNCSSVRWATRVQGVFTTGKGGYLLLAWGLIIIMAFVQISKGKYYCLEPVHAFETFQPYDIGQIARSFLQGSFAYGGWNFLNYVTEELVDPYRCARTPT